MILSRDEYNGRLRKPFVQNSAILSTYINTTNWIADFNVSLIEQQTLNAEQYCVYLRESCSRLQQQYVMNCRLSIVWIELRYITEVMLYCSLQNCTINRQNSGLARLSVSMAILLQLLLNSDDVDHDSDNYDDAEAIQESPADAVKPARRKSMPKLLQFDVFRFISPNSISPNCQCIASRGMPMFRQALGL